jgi:hypothetical protein
MPSKTFSTNKQKTEKVNNFQQVIYFPIYFYGLR